MAAVSALKEKIFVSCLKPLFPWFTSLHERLNCLWGFGNATEIARYPYHLRQDRGAQCRIMPGGHDLQNCWSRIFGNTWAQRTQVLVTDVLCAVCLFPEYLVGWVRGQSERDFPLFLGKKFSPNVFCISVMLVRPARSACSLVTGHIPVTKMKLAWVDCRGAQSSV